MAMGERLGVRAGVGKRGHGVRVSSCARRARTRSTAPAAARVQTAHARLAVPTDLGIFSPPRRRTELLRAPHDLSDGQRRRNWKSWRSTARHPFPGGNGTGGANFVVGVILSVGACP